MRAVVVMLSAALVLAAASYALNSRRVVGGLERAGVALEDRLYSEVPGAKRHILMASVSEEGRHLILQAGETVNFMAESERQALFEAIRRLWLASEGVRLDGYSKKIEIYSVGRLIAVYP